MKHRLDNLNGFTIGGTDGEIGKVKDFYFDDVTWTIRYIIVETGSWLSGRRVLLSPKALTKTEWDEGVFRVNMTTEQIKNSPPIDTDKPVSRQHEQALYDYYPWGDYYWGTGVGMGVGMGMSMSYPKELNHIATKKKTPAVDDATVSDPHLRSANKLSSYTIQASDGETGDVKDFIIDDNTWCIDLLLIDTGDWFPGKKVLISPRTIKEIIWETAVIAVDATKDIIKNSPEYTPGEVLK